MSDLALFAETTYRNQNRKFGIKTDDRRRHMYLIGKTGMGKSTILENMIIEDIRAGRGVAVVDPHGDLAEKVIQYIPSNRINDVIYFNPADTEHPIAFNVVEQVAPELRHLVASGLIGVFEKLWADSWGPRLEYILRNSILAILDYPNSTLLAVTRMLSDKPYRKKVIEKIQDPVVKSFWTKEFAGYADKFAAEAVSPIQNKVGQFLSSSLIRNIVGQTNSALDLREVMDEGKILIMNLSKGRIGEDNSELLGSMVITKIQLAAMSRVNVLEGERRDFYLYVDEFQNFATDSFANILSEARKYRLNLIMGHQYIEQLSDKVKAAVFGNVGTLVVFRVGATDAEELVKEFTPVFTEEDLVNLPRFNTCLKLMIDGIASEPFSARGLPPLTEAEKTGNEEKVILASRQRYAGERKEIEEKIMRWHEEDEAPKPQVIHATPASNQGPASSPMLGNSPASVQYGTNPQTAPYQQQTGMQGSPRGNMPASNPTPSQPIMDPSVYKYEAQCSRCGKMTRVPFQPDGVRPVFCKECLMIMRQEGEQSALERKMIKQREIEQLSGRPRENVIPYRAEIKSSAAPYQPKQPVSAQYVQQAPQAATPRPVPLQRPTPTPAPPFRPQAIFKPAPIENAPSSPAMSLRELSSRPPMDFKGREIPKAPASVDPIENEVVISEEPFIDQNSISPNHNNGAQSVQHDHQRGSLRPGQPIRFND